MYQIKRFSSLTKEDESDIKKKSRASMASLAGLQMSNMKLVNDVMSPNGGIQDKKLMKKIAQRIKDEGINVAKDNRGILGGNSGFINNKNKFNRELNLKSLDKIGVDPDNLGKFGKSLKKGEDIILLGGDKVELAAHELGHARFNKTKIGKVLQNPRLQIINNPKFKAGVISSGLTTGASFASGMNAARSKSKGEKEGVISKNISWAGSTIKSAPLLISEAAASGYGLKELRRAGVRGGNLRSAAGSLAKAGGSYLTNVGSEIAGNYLARQAGKRVGHFMYNKKKDKK